MASSYRRPLVATPAIYVVRKAMSDGLRGTSRFWRVVLVLVLAKRAFGKVMQSDVKTVAYERIKPGETIILRGVRTRDLPS